jgi:hypothetical protein
MTKNIKDLLSSILQETDNWKIQLLSSWQTIFGDLSTKVHLEKIHEDTLVLGVFDSCWLQELYLLTPVLLKSINKTLDQPRIKQLRFKTIGIKKAKKQSLPHKMKMNTQEKIFSVAEHSALQKLKDPELSNVLKKYLLRCHREKI